VLKEEKDCCCFGGGVLLSFAGSFPLVAEQKIGVWPLDASPDQESAALGPPQYLCRSNLLPRLATALQNLRLPCLEQRSFLLSSLPSLQPPIFEVSRRRRQEQICSITFASECPSGSPGRRILFFTEKDTVGLTWTS
jgi:hypothetical protein